MLRLPFLVLFLSPLVTVPVTAAIILLLPDCGVDEPWWEQGHIQRAFLPGLVDLLPFAWLLSTTSRVRWAALIAGLMGTLRFMFPQVALAVYGASSGGQAGDPSCNVSGFLLPWLAASIVGLWIITSLVGGTILFRMTKAGVAPSKVAGTNMLGG